VASSDPSVIRSIAVTTADVVAALETRLTGDKPAVLRVTPPFSGRMRARLHLDQVPTTDDPAPLHLPPQSLVANPPAYPEPDETERRLRSDPDRRYSVERHRELHTEAVQRWREQVPGSIRDRVSLETDSGPHEVAVSTLESDL
jgi:hypothetical protein